MKSSLKSKKAPQTATQKIHRLQKKIYQSLKIQSDDILGKPTQSIQKYDREYQKDLRAVKHMTSLSHEEWIEQVCQTQVTFIADFHTFDQSQKTALRIVRDAFHSSRTKTQGLTWQIGLEMIATEFQRPLDEFQEGLLSLEEFHQIISYSKKWGFPWSHYQPIFDWAKKHGVRLIALNYETSSPDSDLYLRDHWAARVLTDLYANDASQKLHTLVLFGELHIGKAHLPKQLDRISKKILGQPLTWMNLHQTPESLYWKWIDQETDFTTRVAQLGPKTYCIFSSTPWAKLQSLVNGAHNSSHSIQGESAEESPEEEEYEDEVDGPAPIDFLSTIAAQGRHLADFFGIEPPSFEALTLYTIEEADFVDQKNLTQIYSKSDLRMMRSLVQFNRDFYLSRAQVAYLGSPTPHRLNEVAAYLLLQKFGRMKDRKRMALSGRTPKELNWKIFEFTFTFFCTLILNPHRKCDLPVDHLARLKRLTQKETPAKPLFRHEIQVRTFILKLLEEKPKKPENFFDQWNPISKIPPGLGSTPRFLAARYLGKIRGHELHQAFLQEQVSLAEIQAYFLKLT